ncbi:MAG TPA: hypothetical protein VJT81_14860 [Burkholderiales bacterium]|nr:hypothetical protein [Burkholderiales bacterium]
MNRMLSALTAGMMVLAMNGFAVAQDAANKPNTPQEGSPSTQQDAQPATQQPDTQAQPAGQTGDVTAKEQEYLAALKKCESLSGNEKTKCIESAKKKFGQM